MLGYTGDDFIKAPLQDGIPVEFHITESNQTNGKRLFVLCPLEKLSFLFITLILIITKSN